jgi:hypothetical protein
VVFAGGGQMITFPATRVVRIAVPSKITWVSPAASR